MDAIGGMAVVVRGTVVVVAGGTGAAAVVGAGCELHPATVRLATSRAVASGRLGRMVTPGAGARDWSGW
jgi:NaMN:DMB phosphoribosyltransferase